MKNVDVKVIMKGDKVVAAKLSEQLGKNEDNEPFQDIFGIESLNDLEAVLLRARFDIEGFPQDKINFKLDDFDWIEVEGKHNFPKNNGLPREVLDKYIKTERKRIDIEVIKENESDDYFDIKFSSPIGKDDFNENVDQIFYIKGLDQLYKDIYDKLQYLEDTPRDIDFYIDDELVFETNRMHRYHLEVSPEIFASTIIELGRTKVLKLKTMENEDGTFSVKNEDNEMLYRMSDYGYILGEDNSKKFKTKQDAVKAVENYMTGKDSRPDRKIDILKKYNLFLDDERIGTFALDRMIYKVNGFPKLDDAPKATSKSKPS